MVQSTSQETGLPLTRWQQLISKPANVARKSKISGQERDVPRAGIWLSAWCKSVRALIIFSSLIKRRPFVPREEYYPSFSHFAVYETNISRMIPSTFFFTAFISNNSDRGFICWLQKISQKTAAWPDAKVDYRTNTRHSSTFLTCIMRCSADLILKREIKIISLAILFHLFFCLLCLFL